MPPYFSDGKWSLPNYAVKGLILVSLAKEPEAGS
jgi:hypothetical protein